MWHAWPAKQCRGLGSSRYSCGRRIAFTNSNNITDTYTDANGNGYGQCYSHNHCYAYNWSDTYSQADAYCEAECNTKAASDAGATPPMIKRANYRSIPWLLQAVIRLLPCVAAAVVLVVAVRSSPATGQVELKCSRDPGQRVSLAPSGGPTPTPLPCPSCWFTYSAYENFDAVTPPALPPDWLATNAQGPPPFWVTSNSGVPMPPADTPPNALFVDDPSVISDK